MLHTLKCVCQRGNVVRVRGLGFMFQPLCLSYRKIEVSAPENGEMMCLLSS